MNLWHKIQDWACGLPWTDQNYLDGQEAVAAADAYAQNIRDGWLRPGMSEAQYDAIEPWESGRWWAVDSGAPLSAEEAQAVVAHDRALHDHISDCDRGEGNCDTCDAQAAMTAAEQDAEAARAIEAQRRLQSDAERDARIRAVADAEDADELLAAQEALRAVAGDGDEVAPERVTRGALTEDERAWEAELSDSRERAAAAVADAREAAAEQQRETHDDAENGADDSTDDGMDR